MRELEGMGAAAQFGEKFVATWIALLSSEGSPAAATMH